MPRKTVAVNPAIQDRLAYLDFMSGDTNHDERKRMKSIMHKAIDSELTDIQRYCLVEHYLHGRKMKDIAQSMSVNPSTVTRHIRRATEKLRHIASYY